MPGVLTRKTRAARGKLASSKTAATSAANFTKTSKPQAVGKESLQEATPFITRSVNIEIVLPSRKRKAEVDIDSTSKKSCREPERPIAPATPVSRKRKSVRFAESETESSTTSRAAPTLSSRKRRFDSDETSQAEELLERLNLQSPTVSKRSKTTVHLRAPSNDFDLPKELNELLDLHAAFLKSLSMQRAHSGTSSPIDVRTLYWSVTRAWGKRHVELDDIQRCIGVLSWTPVKSDKTAAPKAPFFLCDYGRDKICIEFHACAEPGPLREPKLNMDFEANLRTLWLSRRHNEPATIFIGKLPKAPIQPCAAAKGINPLLASKSQTTLDAFKKEIAQKKQQDQETKAAALAAQTTTASGEKLSLLDRIRLKQAALAQSPLNEPTAAELQRRCALQRAADVAAVIGMLCKATVGGGGAGQRVSFTMTALTARLKDSMRTPVSQEDGVACVRLLAAEVAPGWLRIVKVGGRENVVCMMGLQPTTGEVEERARVLLG